MTPETQTEIRALQNDTETDSIHLAEDLIQSDTQCRGDFNLQSCLQSGVVSSELKHTLLVALHDAAFFLL